MGREIVYCSQCGVRILEKDLAAGRAFTVLDKVFCAECRDQAFTQAKASVPAARPSAAAPARVAAAPARPPSSTTRPVSRVGASAPHAPRTIVHAPNRTPLYIACGVGMLAMVVVIVVIMSKGQGESAAKGGPGAGSDGVKSGPKIDPNETPEERAARKLNELHKFAQGAGGAPESVVKQAKESEKDILNTPSEEAYLKFRKQWERKVSEAEAGKKIDAWVAELKTMRAADPDLLRMKDAMDLLRKAEELAMTDSVDRLADIKNLKKEIEEAAEVRADSWLEEKSRGDKIRAFMREGDFKAAKSIILNFPEHLKMARVWKVQLTRNLDDCDKGIAAQAAKAAGKEPEKDWKAHLRIANNEHNLKSFAKAKESYLKSEAALPPADKLTDGEKRSVAWHLLYNMGCLFAEESKKLEGAEKAKSVDQAFEYLKKSAEAGVFGFRCGCAEHKDAKDHWDTDKDLDTIRTDPRYAELVAKHAK